MHWQIGLLGLGLVAALVVGGVAEHPANFAGAANQAVADGPSGSPPTQAGEAIGISQMPTGERELRPQVGAAGELIGFNGFDGSGTQTIALVHAGKMQIAVYHIDRSGQIRLVSSRPIDADFSLSLNVTAPLPGQIRLLGGQVK